MWLKIQMNPVPTGVCNLQLSQQLTLVAVYRVSFLFVVAMKAMNKVASHINEMQKIHEEYGAVFDQLISEQSSEKKEV